jgi:hypothetical protein
VRVYERDQPVVELCIQPTAGLPWDDLVVMHKLLIESEEARYVKTANRFPPRASHEHMLETIQRLLDETPGSLAGA